MSINNNYEQQFKHKLNKGVNEFINQTIQYSFSPDAINKNEYFVVSNGHECMIVKLRALYLSRRLSDCVRTSNVSNPQFFQAICGDDKCKVFTIPYKTNHTLCVNVQDPSGRSARFDQLLFTNAVNANGELKIKCTCANEMNREMEMDR